MAASPVYLLADSVERRKERADGRAASRPFATSAGSSTACPARHAEVDRAEPDIREGMSREEIDAAIARHAEQETLYDQPYEDRRRSASPARSRSRACRRIGRSTTDDAADDREVAESSRASSSRRSSTTCARPASRTPCEQEHLELRLARALRGHVGPRARASSRTRTAPSAAVAVSDRPGVRHRRRRPGTRGREGGQSRSRRRPAARLRLRLRRAAERRRRTSRRPTARLGRGRRGAQARQAPRPARAHEPRPRDGRRAAQEDRRRQPVHGLRRARRRRSAAPRTGRSSSRSAASTSTTRRPARCARTRPTTSPAGSSTRTTTGRASSSATPTSPAPTTPTTASQRTPRRHRRGGLGEPLLDREPPVPAARNRQDRRQGHQPLRRRGDEGLPGLVKASGRPWGAHARSSRLKCRQIRPRPCSNRSPAMCPSLPGRRSMGHRQNWVCLAADAVPDLRHAHRNGLYCEQHQPLTRRRRR